jgi:hypothetical protein
VPENTPRNLVRLKETRRGGLGQGSKRRFSQ